MIEQINVLQYCPSKIWIYVEQYEYYILSQNLSFLLYFRSEELGFSITYNFLKNHFAVSSDIVIGLNIVEYTITNNSLQNAEPIFCRPYWVRL